MKRMVIDQERNVPALITFIANKLSSSASTAYRRELGVGLIEWRVMVQLAIEPNISASRICSIVGLDKAAVSRSVKSLAGRGLVTVSAADGRRNPLALTPAGRRLHDRGMPVAHERERRLLTGLSMAERKLLIGLLRRLHEKLPYVAALPGAVRQPQARRVRGSPR